MKFNTDKAVTVTDALNTRITVRQFLDTPVPDDVLQRILKTSLRSPSGCLLYTSPSPRDGLLSRMPSSA